MSKTIMIVDDSATVRQQLMALFTENGLRGVDAPDALSALEGARTKRVDMFIIDVNMPGMNGIELVRVLRRKTEYSKVPIFILTSESTADLMKAGKKAGANAWLNKPCDTDVLMKGIRRVLPSWR